MVSLRPNRLFRRFAGIHSGIHGLALIHAGTRVVTTISDQFAEQPHGRLVPGSGLRVSRSSSRTPLAHLVNARSPPPARFHAPFTQHIHALSRVMPWRYVGSPAPAPATGRYRNAQ